MQTFTARETEILQWGLGTMAAYLMLFYLIAKILLRVFNYWLESREEMRWIRHDRFVKAHPELWSLNPWRKGAPELVLQDEQRWAEIEAGQARA
jgi:hypothetical protein